MNKEYFLELETLSFFITEYSNMSFSALWFKHTFRLLLVFSSLKKQNTIFFIYRENVAKLILRSYNMFLGGRNNTGPCF